MKAERFTTQGVPRSDQFDAWRGWQDSLFDTKALCPATAGFEAESLTWRSNGWAISRVQASAIGISRTKRLIRRNPMDHWVITLSRKGISQLTIRDQSLMPPSGLPFVVSLADVLVNERSSYDQVQLMLSRDEFHSVAPLLDAARGTVLDTSGGRLLADYLLMLERHLPALEQREMAQLRPAIETMIQMCLGVAGADPPTQPGSMVGITQMERIRRVVRAHLRSPALTPRTLCQETGISRPALYRLLEGQGGAGHYIRRRRLVEGFRLLSDPTLDHPVSRIARDLCFSSASVFSRAFREEFEMSPSEVRAHRFAGLEPIRAARMESDLELRRLTDSLRLI